MSVCCCTVHRTPPSRSHAASASRRHGSDPAWSPSMPRQKATARSAAAITSSLPLARATSSACRAISSASRGRPSSA